MKLLHAITLSSVLVLPQVAIGNEKLHEYCTEFSGLGVALYENKQKGITFDQAKLFNKLTMKANNMHNEYAMATAMTIKIYLENLTESETRKLAYNGCVGYMAEKLNLDNPKGHVKPSS